MKLTQGLVIAILLLVFTPITAADEGESVLSLTTGLAGFTIPEHSPLGGYLGVDYERGYNDIIWMRGSIGGGVFAVDESVAYANYVELGGTYVIDILRYVPYITLGVGAIDIATKKKGKGYHHQFEPLISLGGGMDVLMDRSRSYGVFAKFESFLGRTAFFQAGVRMSWRWGFF